MDDEINNKVTYIPASVIEAGFEEFAANYFTMESGLRHEKMEVVRAMLEAMLKAMTECRIEVLETPSRDE